jgi:hypothetical protein
MPEPRSYFSARENNLNAPNIDTWVPSTNFLQVGFRPGYSLQARELIEVQSILQNQISTFAEDIGYANGSILKLNEMYLWHTDITHDDGTPSRTYNCNVTISPGYVYIKPKNRIGYFVKYNYGSIEQLSWAVDITDVESEAKVVFFGLNYSEKTILPEQDMDLYDNATGFPNFNAPGAVRYQIDFSMGIDYRVETISAAQTSGNKSLHSNVNNNIKNNYYGFDDEGFLPLFYWVYEDTGSIINEDEFRFLHTEYNSSSYVAIDNGDYGCTFTPATPLYEYIEGIQINARMFDENDANSGNVYGGG